MDKITTITSKGQVTIPKAVRDALGLKPGDKIEFWVDDGRVKFRKAEPSLQGRGRNVSTHGAPPDERGQADGAKVT